MMVLAKASDHPDRLRLRATDILWPRRVEEVEGEAAQDGEVLGAIVAAVAGAVLVEFDVENPVQRVLDRPVTADGAGENLGGEGRGSDVVAGGGAGVAGLRAGRLDAGEGGEAGEAGLAGVAPVGEEPARGRGYPVRAGLDAAVVGIGGLEAASGSGGSAKKASTSRSIAGRFALSASS